MFIENAASFEYNPKPYFINVLNKRPPQCPLGRKNENSMYLFTSPIYTPATPFGIIACLPFVSNIFFVS